MANKFWCFPFLCFLSPEDPSPPTQQAPSHGVEEHSDDHPADPHPQASSNVRDLFSANDNRIDRGEASRAMSNKICCIPFLSFSSTDKDERHPSGDGHSEDFEYLKRRLKQNYNGDLDSFIESISQRLERIEKKKSSSQEQFRHDWHWPSHSKKWKKLETFLLLAMEYPSDLNRSTTDHRDVIDSLLKEIGHENFATAGLLIVAFVLERFPTVSTNKREYLDLLNKMSGLAQTVKDFEESPQLNNGMQVIIKAATELIVKGYIRWCFEMKSSNFFRFFSTSSKKELLREFEQKLEEIYNSGVICVLDADQSEQWPPSRRYPDAVGIIHGSRSSFMDVDLNGLLEYISGRLEQIRNASDGRDLEKLPSSPETLQKLLSKGIQRIYYVITCVINENVRSFLNEIGHASIVTTGLLAVAYVLEKVEDISENNEECLLLLKETFFLAKLVKRFAESPEGMRHLIEETKKLIMESAKTCCDQIDDNGLSKFWKTSVNKSALDKIRRNIDSSYQHINAQMGVRLLDISLDYNKQPRLSRGYPVHAVGIEDSSREVINLLEWGSEKKAAAVIVYGFGGQGKTTLADAVFSQIDFDGCQYSMVEFSHNMDSNNIVELQKKILRDLMGTKNITEFRKHEEGQRLLSSKLREVPALIYIDNVLDKDKLRQLLPLNFDTAKKVRLLITARDINVRKACRMSTPPKGYRMRGISSVAAKSFLIKQIPADTKGLLANEKSEGKLNSKLQQIIELCGGIPLLLTLVAQELHCAKDTQEFFQVIEELEKMEGEEFGEKLESHLVYDNLPQQYRDSFLDICLFFKGWEWDMVVDILGNSVLDKLERRGLVTKDVTKDRNGVVTVHDIIWKIGRRKTEGMRYRFTKTSDLQSGDQKVEQIRYLKYAPDNHLNQLKEMPSNLKYMELDGKLHCKDLENFPTRLLRLPDLRILKLINFEGLRELPCELANRVKGLRQLTLSNCKSLKELPYSISKLKSLRVLKLDQCKSLKELPQELGDLTSLVELDLSYCATLRELPKNFGLLNALQVLNLKGCQSLEMLPHSFEKLSSLKELNLFSCIALKNLPNGLGNLTTLVELDLANCQQLMSIPESIELLKSLPSMDISKCFSLKELPDGFCKLSLTSLILTSCTRLEKLPDGFGGLKCLRVLRLVSCEKLQKLPKSFNNLKCLLHLDLSGCSELEELCENFHALSSLRTLFLDDCKNLKKLPTDFQSLSKLQHLGLRNCEKLEGEGMDNVVKLKSLEMVYITGSDKLVKRWGKIPGDQSWAFTVDTGQDLSEEEKENEWKKLKFDDLLKDGGGEPFHVSSCRLDTIILVMFDGNFVFKHDFPWPLIEETLDDIKISFEMIYIGKHFNKLPPKLAHKIIGHAIDNSDARLLFEKVFFTLKENGKNLWHKYLNKFFGMSTKIVEKAGVKYLSCWKLLSKGKDFANFAKMEEFLQNKCGKRYALEQLAKEIKDSNIHLLRELFVNAGEENCLLGKSHEVGVDELKGKTIFIEIRLANDHIRLQSLIEMYETGKSTYDFEIISIPVGQLSTEFHHFSRDIPWLVVQTPCRIRRAVKYFLSKECQREERSESGYPSRLMKIEPDGKIAAYPVLTMLERWGPEVYPFTDQKIKELRKKEWIEQKSMSTLEFLFKPIKSVVDEVKKVMRQGKMIWLFCDGKHPATDRVRTKTFVGSVKKALKDVKDVRESIHFIYVPPYDEKNKQDISVTDSIKMAYLPLEEPKMPQEKEELGLEPSLHLSQWAAVRFWARVSYLRKEMEGMDGNGKQWDEIKNLLKSLNFGSLSMALMDEDGSLVTTKEQKIMDTFDNMKSKSNDGPAKDDEKKLMQHLN